jgi:hypothetical protein
MKKTTHAVNIRDLLEQETINKKNRTHFRKEYKRAKKELGEKLLEENFLSGRKFYLDLDKSELHYSNEGEPLDERLTTLLKLGSTMSYLDYILQYIDLSKRKGGKILIKFTKYNIIINFSSNITERDFKYMLKIFGIKDIYSSKLTEKKIINRYNFVKMFQKVVEEQGIRVL